MDRETRDLIQEIADRARRTETRVTKIANHVGVDAGGEMPTLSPDRKRILVPSRRVALEDVLQVAPAGETVEVYCGGDFMMMINA